MYTTFRSNSQTNKELNIQHTVSKDFKIFSFIAMPDCKPVVRKEKKTVCLWAGSEVSQTYFLYSFLSRPTEALHRSLLSISHMDFFETPQSSFLPFPFHNCNATISDVMYCLALARNVVLLRLPQQPDSRSFVGEWSNLVFQIYINF